MESRQRGDSLSRPQLSGTAAGYSSEGLAHSEIIWCLQCLAAEKVMSKFGILEVARTGRICLKRGGLRLPVSQSAAQEGRHTKKVAADASRCGGGALPFTHKRKRSH